MTKSQRITAAKALGYFSIGLGLSEIAFPRRISRALGLRDRTKILRAYGAREIAAGVGLLSRQSRPAPWFWVRLGGDMLDLGSLALAARKSARMDRIGGAMAFVLGTTVIDALCAARS